MMQLDEFRAELDTSDDAARERAIDRLRSAQAGATQRAPRASRRRVRVGLTGAVAIATAAGIAVAVGIGGEDGVRPAAADARTVLLRAARSAEHDQDGGVPRLPRPDEWYYLETQGTYRDSNESTGATHLNTRTYRRWESLDRPGRINSPGAPGAMPATHHWFIGGERFGYDELNAFDPTPQQLYQRLHDPLVRQAQTSTSPDGKPDPTGKAAEAETFVELVDALRDVPLPPRLRATFLRTLAEVPGLTFTGPTTDRLGRKGVGVAYLETTRENERHELILADDGTLLSVRDTTAGGALLEDMVIVRRGIATRLGERVG